MTQEPAIQLHRTRYFGSVTIETTIKSTTNMCA